MFSTLQHKIQTNPSLRLRLSGLKRLLGLSQPPTFSGWGMTTEASPPWEKPNSEIDRNFLSIHNEVCERIANGRLKLTQFNNLPSIQEFIDQLRWRHYFVYWTALMAQNSTSKSMHLVECGVCDGLTSYFVCRAQNSTNWQFHLYDAWDEMDKAQLVNSEASLAGAYSHLSVENTQNNLIDFKDNLRFCKGYLPDSFATFPSPDEISWLHIDLNSSKATLEALAYFFDRMTSRSLTIFDDYGHRGYEDTRQKVDDFYADKSGMLLPLPTGQAIFFKI